MTGPEFRAWMIWHRFTEPAAAEALGVQVSTIATWKRIGTRRIVDLACLAINHGLEIANAQAES